MFQVRTRSDSCRARQPRATSAAAGAPASSVAAAAAGAGPSFAAPASAAAAAAGAPAGSVFVKRAGDLEAVFAPVEIFVGDAVGHLAERASAKFRWLVGADKIKLFLVPADSEDAVAAGVDGSEGLVLATRPLSSIKALSAVGIRDRCCLLARLPDPPAAAAGECARAIRSLPSCSSSRGGRRGSRDVRGIPLRSSLGAHPFPFPLLFLSLRRRRWRWRRCWRHCGSRKVSR